MKDFGWFWGIGVSFLDEVDLDSFWEEESKIGRSMIGLQNMHAIHGVTAEIPKKDCRPLPTALLLGSRCRTVVERMSTLKKVGKDTI